MNTRGPIYGAEERQDERAATLSGLMGLLFVSPRVARSSQPWAERCNPFGIEPTALRRKVSGIRPETCATTLFTALLAALTALLCLIGCKGRPPAPGPAPP